jgi:hypothetical protein
MAYLVVNDTKDKRIFTGIATELALNVRIMFVCRIAIQRMVRVKINTRHSFRPDPPIT